MTVSAGAKLGPYSILSRLGKGGMGEVYRARDSRLNRVVAVKIVSPEFSTNPTNRSRFRREVLALSSLSHPNICSVFDVGDQNGTDFLVMEYVEGETLAERLRLGALPLLEVVQYARQIAAALESAHLNGIIHRDLKPGNIMITKSGIKVLDFGLASHANFFANPELSGQPTQDHAPLTREGTIVGTLGYMAPEQLEGKETDARSDIFALGVLIYEMATGHHAFSGGSQASMMVQVLTADPASASSLNTGVPPALERLIGVCLAKKPEDRWESAHDLKLMLDGISLEAAPAESPAQGRSRSWWKLGALAATVAALVLAGILFFSKSQAAPPRVVSSTILPPDAHAFVFMGPFGPPAFSPDAKSVAFVAAGATDPPTIWVRRLDAETSTRLSGTEGAYYPFWSPDGRYIAFFSGTKLKRIAATGGAPMTICDADFGRGGSWNQQDQIIFGKFPGAIYIVSASGGNSTEITKLDDTRQDVTHRWPVFLPDGKHFLYMASSFGPESDQNAIFLASINDVGKPSKLVLHASSNAYFNDGQLFYLRENAIFAQGFDPDSGALAGDPAQMVQKVAYDATTSSAAFSISSHGDLAYQPGTAPADFQLLMVDPRGKPVQTIGEPGSAINPRISPDGKHVMTSLIDRRTGQSNIWILDLDRSTRTRLTFGSFRNNDAIYSPDGNSVSYVSYDKARWVIHARTIDPPAIDTIVYQSAPMPMDAAGLNQTTHFIHTAPVSPSSWTHDGKQILFNERTSAGQWGISLAPADGHAPPTPFLQGIDIDFLDGELSPDGKWIAYESNESGHDEIYVASFPGLKQKQQISIQGGAVPRWRGDGKALCFVRGDKMVSCADLVNTGTTLHITSVRPLFPLEFMVPFDVTPDGQRFVLATLTNIHNPAPLNLITNFTSRLNK